MSLKIKDDISFTDGLGEKIEERCKESIELLNTSSKNKPHHVIHEVRKNFKKIRAALRLIRDHIDFYKEENVFFRDQGRRVSDIRDTTSIIEALDMIQENYADQLYNKTFDTFRNYLVNRRKKLMETTIEPQNTLASIEGDLRQKLTELPDWQFEIDNFEVIYPSVKRVYKRGRKAYQKAKDTQSPEDFHEWRKRVKYLRYQLDLLNRIWPDVLDTWEDELHKLSDALGDDRDLFMLNNVLKKNEDQFKSSESFKLLKSLIATDRKRLQNNALQLGKRLYYLKKDSYTGLLQASWEAYHKK